jgi:hypothetical protein
MLDVKSSQEDLTVCRPPPEIGFLSDVNNITEESKTNLHVLHQLSEHYVIHDDLAVSCRWQVIIVVNGFVCGCLVILSSASSTFASSIDRLFASRIEDQLQRVGATFVTMSAVSVSKLNRFTISTM